MNSHRGERIGASRGSNYIRSMIYKKKFDINKVKPEYRQNLENYRRKGPSRRKIIDDERQVFEDTERTIIEEDPRETRKREDWLKLRNDEIRRKLKSYGNITREYYKNSSSKEKEDILVNIAILLGNKKYLKQNNKHLPELEAYKVPADMAKYVKNYYKKKKWDIDEDDYKLSK